MQNLSMSFQTEEIIFKAFTRWKDIIWKKNRYQEAQPLSNSIDVSLFYNYFIKKKSFHKIC